MKTKKTLTLTAVLLSATLSSCIVPNSPDPVGDSFKPTGDAIGNVVNGVVGTVNPAYNQAQQPYTQPQVQPQYYPQPTPYQGQ